MVYIDQHLLSLVIEHAPIGMAILFPNGKIKMVNTALINILGYSENELNDLSIESLTHPEDVEASVELLTKVKNNYL